MIENQVFARTESHGAEVSPATYNMVLGMTLCWGFLINWLIVRAVDPASILAINPWLFFGGYFASCLGGAYLFNSSHEPAVSFLGYNLVVVPFGLVVNVVVSRYDPAIVLEAIRITAIVTMVMMALGSAFPAFFQRIRTALMMSLLAVIIVELIQIFFMGGSRGWVDWIVVLIFCGYIGYDWGRANQIPKTIDNAIDSAAAIYMDVINLFLRILRIVGRSRR